MKVIGWHLQRLVAEAETQLVGGYVEQLRSDRDRSRLILSLGSRAGKRYVCIGVRGPSSCFYWTDDTESVHIWKGANRTESFNRLRDAQLIGIGMPANDRVIRLEFLRASDDSTHGFSLVTGWTGGRSNVWLVDPQSEQILERLHREEAGLRPSISTRETLTLPAPPVLADWQRIDRPGYDTLRSKCGDQPFGEFLERAFWGIDEAFARAVLEQLRSGTIGDTIAEFAALKMAGAQLIDPATPLAGHTVATIHPACPNESGSALRDLLASLDRVDSTDRERNKGIEKINTVLRTTIGRLERRLQSLDRTLSEGARSDSYHHLGDLLSTHRDQIAKGMSSIDLEDFATGSVSSVALNPARSPQQNIDDYYRKARKLADAADNAMVEKPRVMNELAEWKGLADRLVESDYNESVVAEAKDKLGIDDKEPRTNTTQRRLPYREFLLGRHRLWVGRSAKDNDELTTKHTRPEDLFFHVHGAPGSHVILKRESRDQQFDKSTLLAAAQIAAYFSRAKHAGLVPVVYAEARHVRKPRKAKAGTVTVEREKSLMVRPLPPPGYHDGQSATVRG